MSDHYDKNWQVKYDDSEEKIIIYVEHPPKFGGICPLAEFSCGGPDDVGYEDDMKRAHWMAASPELLDACKQAVCGNMGWKGKLKDAIAKAEKS